MRLELTEEQLKFKALVREFAEKEIAPIAQEIDRDGRFPSEVITKAAKLGLLGITIPKEYGGLGLDNISYAIAIEEISKVSGSLGLTLEAHNSLCTWHIYNKGTEEQRKKYVVPLAKGQYLGAWALTEPLAGSDAASIQTTAVREGDYWVINGTKLFITNSDIAGTIVVMAVTDKSKRAKGISAFIIEKGTEGLSYGKEEDKLGLRACRTVEVILENCKVPKENLLGGEGMGFIGAMETLYGGRVGVAAMAVGIAQAAYEVSLKYSKQRKQFGKYICEFQAIQWMLANMATEIEAARLLALRAAYLADIGKRYVKEASMAKLFASEVAMKITAQAIQILGGYGYTEDYPVERFFRDVKLCEIGEGTSEVERLIISREILKEL
ncbi:MAG: acyl-CoA dehydrogenase family protein [Candidatus Thermoplasmatota archaeon]|nr:acyl-CoA dehydrogenase family protein [Candidatus Thermoplasmatota archaeon]